MNQLALTLNPVVVPTGEAEKQREAYTDEGVWFALSYRKRRVCIDTGLQALLDNLLREPYQAERLDAIIRQYLSDYSVVWWKHPRTGEFLEVERVTTSMVKMLPEGMRYAPRQLAINTLVLTPHYKVPNDQSMGRPALHVS